LPVNNREGGKIQRSTRLLVIAMMSKSGRLVW